MAAIAGVCRRDMVWTFALCLGSIVAGEASARNLRMVNLVGGYCPIYRSMAGVTGVRRREVGSSLSCGWRACAVVAGETCARRRSMINIGGLEGRRRMAIITCICGSKVAIALALGACAVVAGKAAARSNA